MKLVKLSLRLYIAVSTVVGFLIGWVLLAHSGKPAVIDAATESAPQSTTIKLDALPPVPSLNDLVSGAPVQPLPAPQHIQIQPSTGFTPRFRTGGSR